MKVALIHDWLTGMRGGEKVLEVFCELYPNADLYTLLHVPGSCSPRIEGMRIRTSFIQKLPDVARNYRRYLPLFPHAIESFDLSSYDVVISSSHCVAKGVITPPSATHVSYIHTPMRYMWDQFGEYFGAGKAGPVTRLAAQVAGPFLRAWDEASSMRVDRYLANSNQVAERIRKRYRRDAVVIYPPVDLAKFKLVPREQRGDFYLMVGAFAPYKRVDLAIEAFRQLGRPLKIVGAGQVGPDIARIAKGNVELLGPRSDDEIAHLYARCRAFVFPGEEDFGITPLEAQASGRPVIAFGKGGALETVVGLGPSDARPTGVFFPTQSVESVIEAVKRLEANEHRFDPHVARANAETFDRPHFKRRLEGFLRSAIGAPTPAVWTSRPAQA